MSEENVEKLEDQIRAFGRRLGLLLGQSRLPDEQKRAWVELIPHMSPEQLEKFAYLLEVRVPDAEEQAMQDFQGVILANREANAGLDDIEAELRHAST